MRLNGYGVEGYRLPLVNSFQGQQFLGQDFSQSAGWLRMRYILVDPFIAGLRVTVVPPVVTAEHATLSHLAVDVQIDPSCREALVYETLLP